VSPATRRGALARGLAVLGGLIGLGASEAGAARASASLVLYGRNVAGDSRGRSVPERGDRLTLRGELLDAHGRAIGELHGAVLTLRGPGARDSDAERLELHTFELRDGTIVGSGTSGALEGEFAILGGTGRYAGARGTYVARHNRREHGGDGTAEFRLTLTA
jgi:hypothetical protein